MRSFAAAAVLALAGAAAAAPGDIPPDHPARPHQVPVVGRAAGARATVRPSSSAPPTTSPSSSAHAGLQPGGDDGTWFQPLRARGRADRRRGQRALVRARRQDGCGSRSAPATTRSPRRPATPAHAIGDARGSCRSSSPATASWCPRSATTTTGAWTSTGKAVVIFSHEPQERLSSSRHERRAADDGDHARRQGRRGAHRAAPAR